MSWLVRAQADDFFQAYQLLNKRGAELTIPAVVNLAFALELYIKDIYYALNIEDTCLRNRDCHNILELFRKLPEHTQQEIKNYPTIQNLVDFNSVQTPFYMTHNKNMQPITDNLEQQIYKISDAFQKWRYSYENNTLNYEESIALGLIEAAQAVSDKVRRN